MSDLEQLSASCIYEIEQCTDLNRLNEIKSKIFGKNGCITAELSKLKDMNAEEKKAFGAIINSFKISLKEHFDEKMLKLQNEQLEKNLSAEYVDVSLPSYPVSNGTIHPVSKVIEELGELLRNSYGFQCAEGPDIDSEYFNFTAMNIPEHHPARTMHDTFYLSLPADENGRKLLRTHTSAVENRIMTDNKPPFRFFTMGRVFRSDYDATHTPMFNQLEGMIIDEKIGFAHLKWMLGDLLRKFFNTPKLSIRLRPSFFPFTEPSAEVDISYKIENGKMVLGEGNKWLEVCGCGILHPNVLKMGNIDTTKFSGLAFGFGIERLASLKYGIPDLRGYFESDDRWRNTFGFNATDR